MNIIKPILLAIIVLLTGMASTSGMATVELPNVALHPGECTNITVTVKNVNDLAGGRVVLSYNASVIKIEKLNFLINGLNPTPNLNYERNGTVICSFAGSTGVSGNISLMNVSIRAIGVGNTSTPIYLNKTVHINNRDFYTYLKNSASNNINFSMKNGIITIIQPDLTVTNLQVPTNPIVNNTYAINATIKNIGTDNASSFNVVLKDNGNNVATKTVNSLNAKSTTTISFNWKPSTEGAHNLTVVVDSSKQVNETNELNNQLSKMVYVKPIPIHDVAVESVNANNTVVNTTINVTATISNKGNQNETNINVSLYANNQYQSSSFLNLDAGKNKTITFTYIPTTVGTVALKVKAVIKNDNNPSNNEKETTITVSAKPKPDLIPQNISLKSTEGLNEYVENHTYNITALVINTGTNDSGAFNVSLKIDGNTINKTTINSLTKGSSKLVSFLWTPNTTGAHTIEIVADSGNNIDELSENNNKISKQITVNPENTNFSATPKKIVRVVKENEVINTNISIEYLGNINTVLKACATNASATNASWVLNSSKGKDVFTIKLNSTSLTTALTTISNIAIGKKTLILPLSIETPTNISKKGKTYKFDIILKIKDNKITIPVEFLVKGTEPVVDKEKINTTEENNTLNKVLDTIKSMNLTNTTVVDGNNIDLLVNNISKVSPENATPVIVAVSENITPSIENASVKVTSKSETSGYTTYNKKVVNITVNISFENKTNSLVVVAIPLGDYGITDVIKNGNSIPKDTPKNGTHYEITTINGKKVILLYLKDDPVITLVAEKTVSSLYNPPSGGGHHVTVTTKYPDVAQDIKSEKIKEIVHNYKLILGSEIDNNMSAKHLKNTSELINKPLEIKEDCILIGGPVANPLVKKFLWTFPVKVTNNYPGAHKGVIQKQIINGHNVILLAGSDRYGTKAAVEYFKTLDDIPSEPIFVEWKDNKAIKINKP